MPKYCAIALAMLCLSFAVAAQDAPRMTALWNPFFAMDTGTRDAAHESLEAQATLAGELGYAGIGFTGTEDTSAMAAAAKAAGIAVTTLYNTVDIATPGLPEGFEVAIAGLKGQGTILWLSLTAKGMKNSAPEGDALAVALLQRIADRASEAGLSVAIYPHVNTWLERVEDAVRVAKQLQRDNAGMTLNLYHWLREGHPETRDAAIAMALPWLKAVTINGTDPEASIVTLDQGRYPVGEFVEAVVNAGYTGPIGLQGYGIGGDARANPEHSMAAWRAMSGKIAGEWVSILGSDLGGFRAPLGSWEMCGEAAQSSENPKRLTWTPGTAAAVNGPDGKTAHLVSVLEQDDALLHVEFMVPEGSNSGVYLQGRYEIQVLDSYGVEKPGYGDCGGIYQRYHEEKDWQGDRGYEGRPPRVNAARKPGQWQSFDITFRAPRFDANGNKTENAQFVKVVHNGIVVHENEPVTGPTRAAMFQDEKPLGPLMLQGDHGPVAYRNVRLRPL